MNWAGKIIGGIFGLAILGPLGILLGAMVGHFFDKQMTLNRSASYDNAAVQTAFFEALFTCMGHLAKSDGHVSEQEISVARQIMAHMQLTEEQKQQAIHLFNQGKESGYDTRSSLQNLYQLGGRNRNLLRMFLQFQFQAAYADGSLSQPAADYLREIGNQLGFSNFEFNHIASMCKAAHSFQQQRQGNYSYQQQSQQQQQHYYSAPKNDLKNAFGVLGVNESATREEVKRAYRKQMNEYHPDKLVSKGLPESMLKAATAKTQEIKEAYDLIKRLKGWR